MCKIRLIVLWMTDGQAGGENRVLILCNQLLLQLLTQIFETLQNVYGHIEDVHEAVWCHLKNLFHIFHVVELCHFFAKIVNGGRPVTYLCNQLLLQLLTHILQTVQNVFKHTEDVHEAVWFDLKNISIFFRLQNFVIFCQKMYVEGTYFLWLILYSSTEK